LLVKELFDSEKSGIYCGLSFFVKYRKSQKLKPLQSTVAREPAGHSRIP
jgi:hypothetical protein